MDKTKIDWCDSTWNPVTGCFHECKYCYARKIAERFGGKQKYADIFVENEPVKENNGKTLAYPHSFSPTFHIYRLNDYIAKKGRNIFVCSMADLFGDWVPGSWIEEVFSACEKSPQHNYMFLTKNPERYFVLHQEGKLLKGDNIWYGSTLTDPAMGVFFGGDVYNTFLSIEPILQPFGKIPNAGDKYLPGWVIVGAETGRRKEKVIPKREWLEEILEDCRRYGIPLFMKSSLADIWGEPLVQEFPEKLKMRSNMALLPGKQGDV